MGVFFQCPSCFKQLHYDKGDNAFQVCRHCGGKIIVPSVVIHQNEAEQPGGLGQSVETQRSLKLAEIQSELNAGRKIEAIKLFRESFGTGLSEAKDAVEMLEQGVRIPGQALTPVAADRPIEQRIHTNTQVQQGNKSKGASVIFWIILLIGIAIASKLLGE